MAFHDEEKNFIKNQIQKLTKSWAACLLKMTIEKYKEDIWKVEEILGMI